MCERQYRSPSSLLQLQISVGDVKRYVIVILRGVWKSVIKFVPCLGVLGKAGEYLRFYSSRIIYHITYSECQPRVDPNRQVRAAATSHVRTADDLFINSAAPLRTPYENSLSTHSCLCTLMCSIVWNKNFTVLSVIPYPVHAVLCVYVAGLILLLYDKHVRRRIEELFAGPDSAAAPSTPVNDAKHRYMCPA